MRDVMVLGDLGYVGDAFDDELPDPPHSPDDYASPAYSAAADDPTVEAPAPPAVSPAATPPPATSSKPVATSGGVPAVAAAWMTDGTYVVQAGNTMYGIAQTYLGNGSRWQEIWKLQSPAFLAKHPSANVLQIGDKLTMPEEAKARARALGVLKSPLVVIPSLPASARGKAALVALAVAAGAGVVAGIIHLATKRGGRRRAHGRPRARARAHGRKGRR